MKGRWHGAELNSEVPLTTAEYMMTGSRFWRICVPIILVSNKWKAVGKWANVAPIRQTLNEALFFPSAFSH